MGEEGWLRLAAIFEIVEEVICEMDFSLEYLFESPMSS